MLLGKMLLGISIFVMVASIVMFFRNEIVYRHGKKALKIVSDKAIEDIMDGKEWMHRYEQYHFYGSYYRMIFSFTKWKFKDFYKEIEE